MSAQSHYNKQASVSRSHSEAMATRNNARTKPLRNYHNDVKRRMIIRFSQDADHHLDLACGRGGDMWKWQEAGIKHVHGLDIAESEVAEARERFEGLRRERPESQLNVEYEATSELGVSPIPWKQEYETVSCMFAAHYFFESRKTCGTFLDNVARALSDKGVFYGAVTCGKRILNLLDNQAQYRSELLAVSKKWPDKLYKSFGSGYTFAMLHTVTNDHHESDDLGDGCVEYLTFFKVFTLEAAQVGLYPIQDLDWNLPVPRRHLPATVFEDDAADEKYHAFRYFKPCYDGSEDQDELEKISKLYAAFAFEKDVKRFEREQREKAMKTASKKPASPSGSDQPPSKMAKT
eukprot:m.33115 g.33115  ORF g.33115 m.33115 type:complete len:348 (-) comp12197_c0_seq1:61-1104(-)